MLLNLKFTIIYEISISLKYVSIFFDHNFLFSLDLINLIWYEPIDYVLISFLIVKPNFSDELITNVLINSFVYKNSFTFPILIQWVDNFLCDFRVMICQVKD